VTERADADTLRRWIVRGAIVCLYVLGLNPYLTPGLNDNAEFLFLAQSLAAGEGYQIAGAHVVDRAPLLPLLLAPFAALGVHSLLVIKALLLINVLAGLVLVDRVVRRQSQPGPVTVLFAILPTSLYFGTEVMSEWTFLVCSLAFLLLLQRVGTAEGGTRACVLAGLVLALSIGARYVGVLLAVPVLVRMVRHRQQRSVRPELLTLLVAAVPTAGWLIASRNATGDLVPDFSRNLLFQAGVPVGETWGRWSIQELATHQWTNVQTLLGHLADLLTGGASALRHFGLGDTFLAPVILLFVAGLVTLGIVDCLRRRRHVEETAYVLATLVFLSTTGWLRLRYLFPIAPFLVLYVVRALELLLRRFPARATTAALIAWGAALFAGDAMVLFRGDPKGLHGGISMLNSRTETDFYRGEARELYDLCRRIRDEPECGRAAGWGAGYAFLRLYSGRDVAEDGRFAIAWKPTDVGGRLVAETPHYVLLDRAR